MKLFKEFLAEAKKRNLNNVNHVYHDGHPDSDKFAGEYTKAHKGDYSNSPTEKHDKDSEQFYSNYHPETLHSGFAGSGTTLYTHKSSGKKFKVVKTPNGKTFYGTDHHISRVQ